MAESIFTSEAPTSGNVTDGTPYELGTEFIPQVAGTSTHHRFRAPSNTDQAALFRGHLWRVSDMTLLATATYLSLTPDDWNTLAWDEGPVSLSSAARYVTSYYTPDYFVIASALHDSEIDNGQNLVAPAAGDGPTLNGRINLAGAGFPGTQAFGNAGYLSDMVFEPGVPVVDGTGLAELGGLVATGTGVRIVNGAGAAALGGLAAAGSGLRIVPGAGLAALGGLVATGQQHVEPSSVGVASLGTRTGPAAAARSRTGPTAAAGVRTGPTASRGEA